jgi:pimeloyl-ACP methyl ester carboxylesterase
MLVTMLAAALAVSAPIQAGKLAGTLTSPRGPAKAAAVILPGSGPTDRDGNNPLGVKAASYRLLAEGLAERGVATVRIDKRGLFGSAQAGDPNAVTIGDYVKDTAAWVEATRKATGANCAWLIGHSEGGLIALAAAKTPHVCGLVLLSTAGRPLADVIRQQLRANPANAPILDQAEAALAALEAGRAADTSAMHPALAQGLFNPKVQPYLIDVFRYDPTRLIAGYGGPVLIVQGTTDLQVSVEDAKALASAQPRATLRLIEGMSHVLKNAPLDRAANVAVMQDEAAPLSPGLVDSIAGFMARPR